MLSVPELENLLEVLSQPDVTLEDCYNQFTKHFPNDQFRACCVLVNLMNNNLLTGVQRIVAFYIIVESFKNEASKINPFSLNLIEFIDKSEVPYEKKFGYSCFVLHGKENAKINVKKIPLEIETTENYRLPDEYEYFKKNIYSNVPPLTGFKAIEIKSAVPDFNLGENNKYFPPPFSIPESKIDIAELGIQGYQPDFMRPIPNSIPIDEDETYWLNPGMNLDVAWDFNMCIDNNVMGIVKELFQKSLKSTLSNHESKMLIDSFEKDPKLVFHCGVTPQVLPELIENNPSIASTILLKLLPSNQISQYFDKIVNMELSLASLEVVNKIAHSSDLPKEFLTLYITNCISHCEENKKDKVLQNRLVRLVCVFIKSLIKSKIINPRDMYIELQAFCIEFTKISEASSLFKLLKGLDGNPTGTKE